MKHVLLLHTVLHLKHMRADLFRLKYVYTPAVESTDLSNMEDKSLLRLCSGIKKLSEKKQKPFTFLIVIN